MKLWIVNKKGKDRSRITIYLSEKRAQKSKGPVFPIEISRQNIEVFIRQYQKSHSEAP